MQLEIIITFRGADKLSETVEGVPVEKPKRKMWKIILVVAILVTIIFVVFVTSVVYSTSIKVETWGMTKEYEEGFWFILQWTEPKFTAEIKLAIGNPSAFAVTVRDLKANLVLNGIDMGSLYFPEEWYKIPAFGWRVWIAPFSVTADYADSLESADTYNVYVILRGEASCLFYRTLFETTHQKTYES